MKRDFSGWPQKNMNSYKRRSMCYDKYELWNIYQRSMGTQILNTVIIKNQKKYANWRKHY